MVQSIEKESLEFTFIDGAVMVFVELLDYLGYFFFIRAGGDSRELLDACQQLLLG